MAYNINENFIKATGINEPYASQILKDNEHAVWHIPSGVAKEEGRQELIDAINGDEDLKATLTINATPSNAKVMLDGTEQKSIKVLKGTEVSYEVTAEGYEDASGKITVDEDKTEDVVLTKKTYEVTISTTPVEATVKFNDGDVEPTKKIVVEHGQTVKYTVEATGYDPKTETSEAITETKTISVELTKTQCTLTVTATPEGATVKLNGEVKSEITVDYGTSVNYEVSMETYTTQSGSVEVTEKNQTLSINLELAAAGDEPSTVTAE